MSSAARSPGRALPSVNASGVGGEVDQSPLALVCRCFGLQRKHGTIAGRLLCNTMRRRTQSRLSRITSLVSLADGLGSDLVPVVRLRNHAGAELRQHRLRCLVRSVGHVARKYPDQRHRPTTTNWKSASAISHAWKPSLGAAPSVSLPAVAKATLDRYRRANSSTASPFLALVGLDT